MKAWTKWLQGEKWFKSLHRNSVRIQPQLFASTKHDQPWWEENLEIISFILTFVSWGDRSPGSTSGHPTLHSSCGIEAPQVTGGSQHDPYGDDAWDGRGWCWRRSPPWYFRRETNRPEVKPLRVARGGLLERHHEPMTYQPNLQLWRRASSSSLTGMAGVWVPDTLLTATFLSYVRAPKHSQIYDLLSVAL